SNQRWFGEELTIKQYLRNVARTRWLWADFSEYRQVHDLVGADWRELGKRTGKGNTLYRNRGDGTFEELADSHTARAGWGRGVARPLARGADPDGRGVAIADLDGDGRLDIVMANNNAPPTIYLNRLPGTGHWARLTLAGRECNRDAIGAMIRLTVTVNGTRKTLLRQVEAGASYASQSGFAVHFGLGPATAIDAAEILWPNGRRQLLAAAERAALVDRSVRLTEGEGPVP